NASNYLSSIIPDRSRVRHNVTAFTIRENMLELFVFDHFPVKHGASKKPLFPLVGMAVGAKAHIQEIEQGSAARLACRLLKHLHRLQVCKNVAARGICDDNSARQLLE